MELSELSDPLEHLARWLAEAREVELPVPEAMVLATASPEGAPSTRIVLLKGIDERGLIFTSTLYSLKARELEVNPAIAASFWWPGLRRQVRLSGFGEQAERSIAERLFAERRRPNQIQTVISPQGTPIDSLEELRSTLGDAQQRYRDEPPPCPDDWGAIRILPTIVEFWEESDDRMQERAEYRLIDGRWDIRRLAP